MNKNCYRVIFSQARGLFIAVAGSVNFAEKPAESTHKASCSFCTDAPSALFLVYFFITYCK